MTMKPFSIYVPIQRRTRLDNGHLLLEGYCYVNAMCGDGVNLTRDAMKNAAAGYMQWGAIREMHRSVAAGTAQAVEFDDKGAFLRALIVDKDAIEKVEAGVYKGFSVGVRPRVTRGRDVIACDWIENSLVDRPADPDAVFTIARAEGVDPDAEIEVEELAEEPDGTDADATPLADAPALEAERVDSADPPVTDPAADPPVTDTQPEVPAAPKERAEDATIYQEPIGESAPPVMTQEFFDAFMERAAASLADRFPALLIPPLFPEPSTDRADAPTITRAEHETVLNRLAAAESETSRVQGLLADTERELSDARGTIERLRKEPVPVLRPARADLSAVQRTIRQPYDSDLSHLGELQKLREEWDRVIASVAAEPAGSVKRAEASQRLMEIQTQAGMLGGSIA